MFSGRRWASVRPARRRCYRRLWDRRQQDHRRLRAPRHGDGGHSDGLRFGSRLPWLREITVLGEPHPFLQQFDGLAAGCGWPVRALSSRLGASMIASSPAAHRPTASVRRGPAPCSRSSRSTFRWAIWDSRPDRDAELCGHG